jgi:hypothetical protein
MDVPRGAGWPWPHRSCFGAFISFETERRVMTGAAQAILAQTNRPMLPAIGPGKDFQDNLSSVLLFDTNRQSNAEDLISRFWQTEFDTLDWLADYLRDENVVRMVDSIDAFFEDDDDGVEMWSKADLNNLATDACDDS